MNMKSLKTHLAAFAVLAGFSSMASAIVPIGEPEYLYANSAKLYCLTAETCGSYTADFPLTVTYANNQARLYWSQNKPAGIAAGQFLAHAKGAACPAGSALSNMTAKWYLGLSLKPYRAVATHCDGVTKSEFRVVLSGIQYNSGFGGM